MKTRMFWATMLATTCLVPGALQADGPLPTDPNVVAGDITISTPSATQMLVEQAGAYGIVDWGSFSIANGFGVNFQNGTGATLNRVTGNDLSQIMGSLTGTGSVYLVNQNGIVFGASGVVNTGGTFVASTLDIDNADFLDGGDATFRGDADSYVINLGAVSSLGGDVAILARNVVNEGVIAAPNGTVGLAVGREILMRDAAVADGLFSVRIGGADTSVTEAGTIRAAAAELRANGGNVYALAGNTEGTIAATGVARIKGRVFLTAGDGGQVRVDKTVKATDANGTGGTITVDGASVDAGGVLDASGTRGGEVRITSSVATVFTGEVLAFGDGTDGSGGFAEVSGRHLTFGGTVDTGGGTVLIDPNNIEIGPDGATTLGGASLIFASTISTLLSTQNVIIETSGSDGEAGTIAVTASVLWSSAFGLSLLAHGDVLFTADVLGTNGANGLNVVAGWDGSTSTTAFDPAAFLAADLTTTTLFGNDTGAGYTLGGGLFAASGSVVVLNAQVGVAGGATSVFGNAVAIGGSGTTGPSQLGFNITDTSGVTPTGDIMVRATGDVTVVAGGVSDASAQIGHVGVDFSDSLFGQNLNVSGDIVIEAAGAVGLEGGGDDNAYAMIGHGSRDFFSLLGAIGDRSGAITITAGGEVSIQTSTGFFSRDAWIGHESRDGIISGADITVTAANFDQDNSTLVGAGGTGALDIGMVAATSEGGTITYIATDATAGAGLSLVGSTGSNSCECDFVTTAGNVVIESAGDILLDSTFFFSNTGGGNVSLQAGANFHNNSGADAFGTMTGFWRIYSTRPDLNTDDIGVLDPVYLQYSVTYDPANPFGTVVTPYTGKGLLYSVLPLMVVDDVTITYGETPVTAPSRLTVNGLDVDALAFGFDFGDTFVDSAQVTLSGSGFINAGTYATAVTGTLGIVSGTVSTLAGFLFDPGTLTVNQVSLTASITGTPTKVYDGNDIATLTATDFLLSGFISGEGATVSQTVGTYASANSNGAGAVAVSAVLAAGDYVATGTTSLANYVLPTVANGSGVISPASISVALVGTPTKVYDGSDVATLTSANFLLSGFVGTEGATVTETVGTYSTANAAASNLVTVTLTAADFAATGTTLLSNYTLPGTIEGAGSISQASLTAALIGTPTKVYDGGTLATLTAANFLLSGFAVGEGATVTETLGNYATANAAASNLVTVLLGAGDIAPDRGTDLANYVLPTTATGNGAIDQATLTASVIGVPTKVYDGNAVATLTAANFLLGGFVGDEGAAITQTAGTYATGNASASNLVTVALAAGDFAADSGTLLANYVLPTTATGNGVIDQATITGSIVGTPTKVYDGNAIATLTAANYLLSGFVAGEGATVTETVGSYATANASASNLVTVVLAAGDFTPDSGTLLANYVLPTTVTGNGAISRGILVSGIITGAPSKVYDGTNVATLTAANFLLSGFASGEGATVTEVFGTYASANASGTNLVTVTLTAEDFVATGSTVLANYVLPTTITGNGVITQVTLTGAVIGTPTKVYDGTTLATLTSANFLLSGFIAGEGASVTETVGTYAGANASASNLVTVALTAGDFAADSGTLLANYVLPTTVSGNGAIDQAVVSAAIIGTPTKVYDGTTAATLTAANFLLTGFIAGEGATVTETVGTYATANASARNLVTVVLDAGDFAATGGTLLANYALPTTVTGNGVIGQGVLVAGTITGVPTKVYDGTNIAMLTAANFLLTGFAAGEGATITETAGTYASANAGAANVVTVTLTAADFVATGSTQLANYVLPTTVTGTGSITQATLTGSVIGAPTKVYDGTAVATLTAANFLLTGFVAGETATVSETVGSYASANAAAGNLVTVALGAGDFVAGRGTLLANYALPTSVSGLGSITQATLTGSVIGAPTRVYDGTAVATLTAANFLLTGFVAGEGAAVTETVGTYATANAAPTNLVTVVLGAGDFAADGGTLLANYVLPTTVTGAGAIDQAVLTASIIGLPTKAFDGNLLALLTSANFELLGFVAGEGAVVTQTSGTYATATAGAGNTVTATLSPNDFVATGTTLLANYILPTTASGPGLVDFAPANLPPPPITRGLTTFETTTLGVPSGPAVGLEVINPETTQRILDEIRAGSAFCKALVNQEYVIDCLSDRLQSVADGLSAVGEYAEVRAALEDAAAQLHALALANASSDLAQQVVRAAGRRSSRPLTAIASGAMAAANSQAAAIIESAELVLLRSSSGSEQRAVAFTQVAQVVNSTKVLLRSS